MDGIIVINKEKGYTSNDVVQIVKKTFHEKVGHTGTLDPLATGVLPLLIGKGTKLSQYLTNHDKTYIATISLGEKSSTGDQEGEIVETMPVTDEMLDENNVKNVLSSFVGEQQQKPPIYSAIKVNGKKLYEYARKGQEVEIPLRTINIYNIRLLNIDDKKVTFEVDCSKGTYIRTLCEDIACKLGTVGFMSDLNRTRVGEFTLDNAVKIGDLEKDFENFFIPIEKFAK